MLFGHATLTITRLWDDDEVVLAPHVRALGMCVREGWREMDRRQAGWLFDRMDRWSRAGVRDFVSQAHLSSFPVSSLDDHQLRTLVRQCLADGRIVALRKGLGGAGQESDPATEQRHVVRTVEALTHGRLDRAGRRYRLVASPDLARVSGRNDYAVVPRSAAQRILDEFASSPSVAPGLAEMLGKARGMLSNDWRPPVGPDGLILLRKEIRPTTVSVIDEPAITPSRMRTLMDRTWYEVLLLDEVGQPLPSVELCVEIDGELHNGKTDSEGKLHLGDVVRDEAKVRFAEPQAVLELLDARWAEDRPDDWIVPSADDVVLEICRASSDWRHSFTLQPETPRIVVVEPPYSVRLYDEHGDLMSGLDCKVAVGGQTYEATSDGQGWIEFPVGQHCPESATVEWQKGGVTYGMEVKLQCHEGEAEDIVRARLWNLGFQSQDDASAVADFQCEVDMQNQDGELSAEVVEQIASRWAERNR